MWWITLCVFLCVCVCVAVIGVSCLTLHISLLSFFSVPVCVLSVKQSEHLCLYDCGVSVCVCAFVYVVLLAFTWATHRCLFVHEGVWVCTYFHTFVCVHVYVFCVVLNRGLQPFPH